MTKIYPSYLLGSPSVMTTMKSCVSGLSPPSFVRACILVSTKPPVVLVQPA